MSKAFHEWQESSKNRPKFSCGEIVQQATVTKLTKNDIKAYDAPFPDETFQAGPRIMPSLVPTTKDDPEHEANKKAWEQFFQWKKIKRAFISRIFSLILSIFLSIVI